MLPARAFVVAAKCCRQLGTFLLCRHPGTLLGCSACDGGNGSFCRGAGGCFGPRGNRVPFREQIPGRSFPEGSIGKLHPSLSADSGLQFPLDASTGKPIPFRCSGVGFGFRSRPVWEAMAQNPPCANLSIERRCMFALSCMVKLVSLGKRLAKVNKMQRPVGAGGGTRT